MPGHRRLAGLANSAFTRMVPVALSTALSRKFTRPARGPCPSAGSTVAVTGPSASALRSPGSSRSGSVKETWIGSTCATVTITAPPGCTRLPARTPMAPVRPAKLARTCVLARATFADSTAAVSTASCPASASTWFWAASSAACAMNFCAKSWRWRSRVRWALARSARSFCTWASAFFRAASSARESRETRSWPRATDSPSRMCTSRTVLVSCARRSTLCSATTVPLARRRTGTSRFSTTVAVIGTGAGPGRAEAFGPLSR